jgi:hypothetical protein
MRWLKLQMPEEKLRCFKWYYDDNFSRDDINLKIAGLLKRRYNWRTVPKIVTGTLKQQTIKLESSEVQSFYKASLNKDTHREEMDAKEHLYWKPQEKDAEGQQCLLCLLVQVVLPTYMASAFGLDKEFL